MRLEFTVSSVCSATGDARMPDFTRDGFAVRPRPEAWVDEIDDYEPEDEGADDAIDSLFGRGRRPTMEG